MKRKLRTKASRAVYQVRKTIVEPVSGQMKKGPPVYAVLAARVGESATRERALVATAYNPCRLFVARPSMGAVLGKATG
jgi:hypothetical protein